MAYYDTVIAADGPVAWWPLTDASGAGTLVDSGGTHPLTNHGLVMGTANSPVAGDTTALCGSGYSQGTYLPTGLTAATAECWTYITGEPAVQYALQAGINSTDHGIGIYFQTTGAFFRLGVGTTLGNPSHANAIVENTWQYWAYSWDGAHITSYLNGAQLGAPVTLAGTTAAGGNTTVGSQTTVTNEFQGVLAQVAVYNYDLTAAQVLAHYNAAVNPPASGPPLPAVSYPPAPYWARGAAERHFAHQARTLGTLGRGSRG